MSKKTNNPSPSLVKSDYSIGVVTYVARFEEFFQPLIKQLARVFPDKEVICAINGHPNQALQIDYLKHVTAFLAGYPNVRYLTYEANQPLAKCWNWLLMMSFAPRMLILNDDVSLNLLFRQELERALAKYPDFFTINRSWSHFIISKGVIKKVGWFEERLKAIGQEDGDYQIRMDGVGLKLVDVKCHGVINYIAPQVNAGWQNISAVSKTGGKASEINDQFFAQKFSPAQKDEQGRVTAYKLNPGMETPMFYSLSVLDDSQKFTPPRMAFQNFRPNPLLIFLLPFQWAYSFTRKTGGQVYRFIKSKTT